MSDRLPIRRGVVSVVVSGVAIAGAGGPAIAQTPVPQPGNIVQTSTTTVEVLGLRRWTIAMLNDSLRKYEGYDLSTAGAHACAATLRYKLGFADAAAIMLPGTATTSYWVVTVVEPQDSSRVKYRALPIDTTRGRPEWAEARRLMQANREVFGLISGEILARAVQSRGAASVLDPAQAQGTPAPASLASPMGDTSSFMRAQGALRAWFAAHASAADYELALTVVRRDSNMLDRILALNVILSFLDDDRAWTALSETLLESDGPVRGTGFQLFRSVVASGKRPKDLAAIFPALHAVLNGTSQVLMPQVVPLIFALRPGEAMAAPLLKNGGEMLLAHASARHRTVRDPALALLAALSPKNYGRDVERWRAWVASL